MDEESIGLDLLVFVPEVGNLCIDNLLPSAPDLLVAKLYCMVADIVPAVMLLIALTAVFNVALIQNNSIWIR